MSPWWILFGVGLFFSGCALGAGGTYLLVRHAFKDMM